MPNWVYVSMTISGKPEDIDCFLDSVASDVVSATESQHKQFSFRKILPVPAQMLSDRAHLEQVWGTRQDAYSSIYERNSDSEVEVCFDTAWSFPTTVIAELVSLFPELTITGGCSEEHDEFYGEFDNQGVRLWRPEYAGVNDQRDHLVENMLDPSDPRFKGEVKVISFPLDGHAVL